MINTLCMSCGHYMGAWRCLAFLDGIPRSVQSGENDHSQPIKGDNGLHFKAIGRTSPKKSTEPDKEGRR